MRSIIAISLWLLVPATVEAGAQRHVGGYTFNNDRYVRVACPPPLGCARPNPAPKWGQPQQMKRPAKVLHKKPVSKPRMVAPPTQGRA